MMSSLHDVLTELARALAPLIAAEMNRGATKGMIDQAASPLGNRRHCAAVKKRVACGKPGAYIVGRAHLLSPEALGEELAVAGKIKTEGRANGRQGSIASELERELRIVRGGRQ